MNVYGSDFQCDSPNNVSDYLPVSVTVFVPKNGDLNTINPPQRQFPSINGSSSFTFKWSQELYSVEILVWIVLVREYS